MISRSDIRGRKKAGCHSGRATRFEEGSEERIHTEVKEKEENIHRILPVHPEDNIDVF